MPRRLAQILATISLVFLPLLFAPPSAHAIAEYIAPTNWDELDQSMKDNSAEKYLQEFCKKRQGNQMNLETWYSGKCPNAEDTFDNYSGEGIGFSDIVILDLAEKIVGSKSSDKGFTDTLFDIINKFEGISSTDPKAQQLALDGAQQELLLGQNNGLVGQSGQLIASLFKSQPSSAASYLAYVTNNLQKHKIIPPALAAVTSNGIGFETFSPFLTIWLVFRNLAYLGLVVFFIVYGFMMMFRVNLGQKTVISVQLAIPKLIVTLLIITFSYAIVGIIYDLMWVVIYFAFGYLHSQGIIYFSKLWQPAAQAAGRNGIILSLVLNMFIAGPIGVFSVLSLILGGIGSALLTITGFFFCGWMIMLAILIAVVISYVKLFFKLISAFISIIISLVTGPLVLLGNAFPGSQAIGTWFRSIVANISVFPVTMLLLMFSYILMIQPIVGLCSDISTPIQLVINLINKLGIGTPGGMGPCEYIFGVKNLVPHLTDSSLGGVPLIAPASVRIPLGAGITVGGFSARALLALLGVGLLLMASKYVDIVRDALKVPPFKYGADIANALKMGIKYAPMTPGVGDSIRNDKRYQTIANLSNTTPTTQGQIGAGPQKDTSTSKAPVQGGTRPSSESNSWGQVDNTGSYE